MTDSPTTFNTAPRPRVLHTAAGVVAGYIHELSERHREAERRDRSPGSLPATRARPAELG